MVHKIFTIIFVDGSKLWATHQNGEVCFGTLGKGYNLELKEKLKDIPYNVIIHYAYENCIYNGNVDEFINEQ